MSESRTDGTTTGAADRVTVRSPMGTPIRIIVGEPDYLAREGLVRALEAAEGLEVVSICSTMTSLESAAQLEQPDVVLMPLALS